MKLWLVWLFALTGSLAGPSSQIESKRAQTETTADSDPNSSFWRGVAGVFTENDGSGNPVPGYRTEIRTRWTKGNYTFFLFAPTSSSTSNPIQKTETETNELWKWDVAEVFNRFRL